MVVRRRSFSIISARIVKNDVLPLVRIVANHDGARRLHLAQVDRLVRDVGRDEEKLGGDLITTTACSPADAGASGSAAADGNEPMQRSRTVSRPPLA
jgi:hypothetical protein